MTIKAFIADSLHRGAGIILGFAALGLAVTGVAPVSAHAEEARPLMWVVRDEDSTLYLLGSIHMMKPGTEWQTPTIKDAFAKSDTLWLELTDMDDQAKMMGVIQRYGIDPGKKVTDGLTAEEITKLDELLKKNGMSVQMVTPMKKWLVALLLVQFEAARLGYDFKTGVDLTLLNQARERKMALHGFETAEDQIRMLAGGSDEEDLKSLRQVLAEIGTENSTFDRLFNAWASGNEAGINAEMNKFSTDNDPALYKRLLIDRNASWIPQIETILKGKGTVFVAVGAGHLVGQDSVIKMLKDRGIKAEKVSP